MVKNNIKSYRIMLPIGQEVEIKIMMMSFMRDAKITQNFMRIRKNISSSLGNYFNLMYFKLFYIFLLCFEFSIKLYASGHNRKSLWFHAYVYTESLGDNERIGNDSKTHKRHNTNFWVQKHATWDETSLNEITYLVYYVIG